MFPAIDLKKVSVLKFLFFILCFVPLNITELYSQKLEYEYSFDRYISDSLMNNIPYGVYLTHQEFLSGNPSITRPYEMFERSIGKQLNFNRRPRILYVVDEKLEKRRRYRGKFWCAFDGQDMYLLYDHIIYKLEYTGRFNFCWYKRYKTAGNANFSTGGTYTGRRYIQETVRRKIVDFKTNEWYGYNKRGVKKLLYKNDRKLYDKFILEKRKRLKLYAYLQRLNGIKVAGW